MFWCHVISIIVFSLCTEFYVKNIYKKYFTQLFILQVFDLILRFFGESVMAQIVVPEIRTRYDHKILPNYWQQKVIKVIKYQGYIWNAEPLATWKLAGVRLQKPKSHGDFPVCINYTDKCIHFWSYSLPYFI